MNGKTFAVGLTALVVLGTASYGAYWLGMRQGMDMSGAAAAPSPVAPASAAVGDKVDPATGRRVLYWHDPMVPGQKFDKPGKSPFMDMQLVPVYADEAGDAGTVSISPRVVQNLGVRTAEVVKGSLAPGIQVVGSVAYNERELVLVQARVGGFVEKLYVRAPLDPVRKGQSLVEVLAPDWVAAQEEYLALRRMQVVDVESLREAAQQRMRLVGMTEDAIRHVENTGKVQARAIYYAPIGGVVAELGVREGMTVIPGATLFRINGLGSIWINAEVPEAQAGMLKLAQPIEARASAYPGTVFKGRIGALLPQLSQTTRTITARIELANSDGRLVPGMFVTVDLASAQRKESLIVPSEALIQTGERSVVIVALGEGKFQPVDVQAGAEANGQTEIRRGLKVRQKVVVSGQFLLDSEASLKSTTTRMQDMPLAQGAAQSQTYSAVGRLVSIGTEELVISHEAIPSAGMGAMTMPFRVPASGTPKNIAVGSSVTFEFRQTSGGELELTRITPLATRSKSAQRPPALDKAAPPGANGAMKDGMKGMTK